MKTLVPALCLALLIPLTGCVRSYKLTLTNGNEITTKGKPKLDEAENVYRYKDARGDWHSVPTFRVRQIEPN